MQLQVEICKFYLFKDIEDHKKNLFSEISKDDDVEEKILEELADTLNLGSNIPRNNNENAAADQASSKRKK